jgi:hypothetical protein
MKRLATQTNTFTVDIRYEEISEGAPGTRVFMFDVGVLVCSEEYRNCATSRPKQRIVTDECQGPCRNIRNAGFLDYGSDTVRSSVSIISASGLDFFFVGRQEIAHRFTAVLVVAARGVCKLRPANPCPHHLGFPTFSQAAALQTY